MTAQNHKDDDFEASCQLIEQILAVKPTHRESSHGLYIERGLYVVKQGSAYITVSVLHRENPTRPSLVRIYAHVATQVSPDPSLFEKLLILNGRLRFGAFAYEPKNQSVLFAHTLLGGATLEAEELQTAIHDVAVIADAYDDRIVSRYGGKRMVDVIEESAWEHILQQTTQHDHKSEHIEL